HRGFTVSCSVCMSTVGTTAVGTAGSFRQAASSTNAIKSKRTGTWVYGIWLGDDGCACNDARERHESTIPERHPSPPGDTLHAMFKVLHSSAGAGKTHALVKHYLLLALRGSDPSLYTHILALTFTNKAAAEMRERVLE